MDPFKPAVLSASAETTVMTEVKDGMKRRRVVCIMVDVGENTAA